MNIRFSDAELRCRVTRGELEQLLQAGSLKLAVALPRNHSMQVTVRSAPLGSWQLDSDPTGLWIGIPRSELEQLARAQPSRDGIAHQFAFDVAKHIDFTFEVDVRKRPRNAVARAAAAEKTSTSPGTLPLALDGAIADVTPAAQVRPADRVD